MNALCLVDFFNLDLWRKGHEPSYADFKGGIEDLIAACLSALRDKRCTVRELHVRLYGGWYQKSVDDPVPARTLCAAVLRDFPTRSGPRLRIEMADAPIWDRSLRMLGTLRTVPLKLPPVVPRVPGGCASPAGCAIDQLACWFSGKCPAPGCSATTGQIAQQHRQKMVDTLLVADGLTAVREQTTDVLVLASDDADFIPLLLAAVGARMQTIHLQRRTSYDAYFTGVLELHGLHTQTW